MKFITTSCTRMNEREGIHTFPDEANRKANIALFYSGKNTGGILSKNINKTNGLPHSKEIKRVEIVYKNFTHPITQFRPLFLRGKSV